MTSLSEGHAFEHFLNLVLCFKLHLLCSSYAVWGL